MNGVSGFFHKNWLIAAGISALLLTSPGCREKDKTEILSLKGRIEKIKRTTETTGEITVRFFHEKQNQELVGTAEITPETRIEKNGAPATFQDLQDGSAVKGQVRVEKVAGQRKFTAMLIQLDEKPASSGG